MNIYRVTVQDENKNTKTGATSLVPVTEQYFSEYVNADVYCKNTYGELDIFGNISTGHELRCGKFANEQYASAFDTSELLSRVVINIVVEKLQ